MFLHTILIAFCCAAMNHMELIAAAEKVLRFKLPVLDCPKCSAFWLSLIFGMTALRDNGIAGIVEAMAVAFAAAYLAMWMELLMGGIDVLYSKLYDTFYPTAADATDYAPAAEREKNPSAEGDSGAEDAMPEVR